MNPMMNNLQRMSQIAKMVKSGSPKDLVMQQAKNCNNPMIQQLIKQAENGDTTSIENFGRNFFKEQGIDLDEQMNDLHNMMDSFK